MSTENSTGCCTDRSGANTGSGSSASNIWDKPGSSSDEWGNIGGDLWGRSGCDDAWRKSGVIGNAWGSSGKDDGWESSEKIGGDGFGGDRWGNIGRVCSGGNDVWGNNSSSNNTWGNKVGDEVLGNSGGCDVWGSSSDVGGIKWGSVGKDGDSWGNNDDKEWSNQTLASCSKVVGEDWGSSSSSNSKSGDYGWGICQTDDNEWGNVSNQAWSKIRKGDDKPAKKE